MKANIRLERIGGKYMGLSDLELLAWRMCEGITGDPNRKKSPPKSRDWVAEITGFDARYGYKREFMHGKPDYALANSKGTRGVCVSYILESGCVYEVAAPQSWSATRRYYATVTGDGDVVEISKEVLDQCLRSHSESTFAPPPDNG